MTSSAAIMASARLLRPPGPTRASTAAGRAQRAGSARRAGESGERLSHVRAAAGGALDPIEGNSAVNAGLPDRDTV